MKDENRILTCIQERPGISAKKIVSCMDSKPINFSRVEENTSQVSVFKELRTLKRKGRVHNRGDRWYIMDRNN